MRCTVGAVVAVDGFARVVVVGVGFYAAFGEGGCGDVVGEGVGAAAEMFCRRRSGWTEEVSGRCFGGGVGMDVSTRGRGLVGRARGWRELSAL